MGYRYKQHRRNIKLQSNSSSIPEDIIQFAYMYGDMDIPNNVTIQLANLDTTKKLYHIGGRHRDHTCVAVTILPDLQTFRGF